MVQVGCPSVVTSGGTKVKAKAEKVTTAPEWRGAPTSSRASRLVASCTTRSGVVNEACQISRVCSTTSSTPAMA